MGNGKLSRRGFIERTAGTGLAIGVGAIGSSIIGAPYVARAANRTTVVTANLAGGWSNLANELLMTGGFDSKHGLKFEPLRTYNRLGTYYADILRGNFQIGIGTWDAFANMNLQGAPVGALGVVSTASLAGFFTTDESIKKIEDLKGKTVSAMQVSGTFKMAKTWAKEFAGFDLEENATIMNAPNPPATITMVAAKRADAALAWEHALSAGMHQIPGSRVALNLNDFYREHTGRDQPYFAIGVNTEAEGGMTADTVKRLNDAWTEALNWIMANPGEFQALGPSVNIDSAVLKTAMESGRMQFAMRPMSDDKNREEVQFAADIMQKHGLLSEKLPPSFYIG
ncbi:MAG: ABC transporter substrate-binding protein [Rhodospirillaceae bacterium]